jgi:TetR/AcrR family transcriptional regulator, transcriptional repressor for nem operon
LSTARRAWPSCSMRVSREKAAENRQRIIDAAGALFRAKGFAGIGVADIMRAADLTHGGFYGHFASKDDLAAQASRRALARSAAKWERIAAGSPKGAAYAALLANYLTPTHRDDPARGCAFASLGSDAARGGKAVRAAFAEGLRPFLDILAEAVPGRSKATRRRKAVATIAALVGAVTLARAVGDRRLSDEILESVHRELLGTVGR